jgi:ketosteroid isomerase-like protein
VTSFIEVSESYHRALKSFILGDPDPVLAVWSTRDDATLANPFGPPVRGFEAIRQAAVRAAAQVADGTDFTVERISAHETAEVAYELEIHRFQGRMGGATQRSPVSLRVTTIYRHEGDDGWRVVHRHADPIGSGVAAAGGVGRGG